MNSKINISALGNEAFYKIVYPAFAKEFLFGNNYENFAELIAKHYVLNSNQWYFILKEWEYKESLIA